MSIGTTSYSYDFYLRNLYSTNRLARKAENRLSMKSSDLVQADSDAVRKIADKLRELTYSSDEASDIYTSVKTFVETYNNLLSSTGAGSDEAERIKDQIKSLTKGQKDELEDLGISISASGKLSLDKTKFGECKPSKIERFFGKDSEYMSKLKTYATRAKRAARREPVTESEDEKIASKETTISADSENFTNFINILL